MGGGTCSLVGLVEKELELTFEECRGFPEAARVVGVDAFGQDARALRFSALVERVDASYDARWVVVKSADGGFAASLPIEEVVGVGLLVYAVGEEALPAERGGPFRLWLPEYRDPCANVRDVGTIEFADVPKEDTRPSRSGESCEG